MATDAPRAKKSLGQNFLQDSNIARKIVGCLGIGPQDRVLEIGPGPGMLSSLVLAQLPARFCMVEKDAYWAGQRAEEARAAAVSASVILADALRMDWNRFSGPWKFLGNLPYNVASPLMWDLFSRAAGLERAVFMVQKEVGLRLKAAPGNGAYGALSVWVQSFVAPCLEFIVPPQVFRPRPKVDSAVLSFTPLGPDKRPKAPENLARLLKTCFQQRRKQLGVIFRNAGLDSAVLERHGVRLTARPEELEPGLYARIALELAGKA